VKIRETASSSIACLTLLAVCVLASCRSTGPTGPSQSCSACLDSSGCAGDPACAQAKCGFVCGGSEAQGTSQCEACTEECGSNTQCYEANCVSLCATAKSCQSCTQDHCGGEEDPTACIQEKCASVCGSDAAVPDAAVFDAAP
jgi:hypothetical protein